MKNIDHQSGRGALLVSLLVAIAPIPAFAQIEEVVVTARKRSENLQDVPLSISAFSADDIDKRGIYDVRDVAKYASGVFFTQGFSPTDNRIIIRGLAPTRGRPNVATLVDGIDVTSEAINFAGGGAIATQMLLDTERVEIVKGPQSALYGRSAFGGAIQYVTKDPTDEFEIGINADLNTADARYVTRGFLSGPLGDTFGYRVNGTYWSRDAYYTSTTGEDVGGDEGWGIAATFKFEPSDTFDAKARFEYLDSESEQRAAVVIRHNRELPVPQVGCGDPPLYGGFSSFWCADDPNFGPAVVPTYFGDLPDADGLVPNPSPSPFGGGLYPGQEMDVFRTSLVLNWQVLGGTVSSWTGYTDAEDTVFADLDSDSQLQAIETTPYAGRTYPNGAPIPDGTLVDVSTRFQQIDQVTETEQFSQELRWASDFEGDVQVQVGGLYWTEDVQLSSRNATWTDFATPFFFSPLSVAGSFVVPKVQYDENSPAGVIRPRDWARETDSWSVYGLVEWQLAEAWTLTVEARYVDEESTLTSPVCPQPCDSPFSAFPSAIVPEEFFTLDTRFFQVPFTTDSQTTSEDFVVPRFSLQWAATDSTMLYTSIAKGVKPGGISTLTSGTFADADFDGTFDEFRFDAEKLWAYEFGAKSAWLEDTLVTNAALYFQDYTDKQVSTAQLNDLGEPFGVIENAGEAEIWGFELDATWRPVDYFDLIVAYAYTDAEYTDFEFLTNSPFAVVQAGNCIRDEASLSCRSNYNGNQIEEIPEHAWTATAGFNWPSAFFQGFALTNDAAWLVELDGIYTGERFIDESNKIRLDDNFVANLRAGLTGESWSVIFYVDNLLDEDAIQSATTFVGDPDAETVANQGSVDTLTSDFVFSGAPTSNIGLVNLPTPRNFGVRINFQF